MGFCGREFRVVNCPPFAARLFQLLRIFLTLITISVITNPLQKVLAKVA